MRTIRKFICLYKIDQRKKTVFTEKEKNIINTIRLLCSDKNSSVKLTDMGYSLINEPNHIDCLVSGKIIILTNTVSTSEKEYSDSVIKKVKRLCENRCTNELNDSINNMLSRENIMMKKIIKSLIKNKRI